MDSRSDVGVWELSGQNAGPIGRSMTVDEVAAVLGEVPWVGSDDGETHPVVFERLLVKLLVTSRGSIQSVIIVARASPIVPSYRGVRLRGSVDKVTSSLERAGAVVRPHTTPGFLAVDDGPISLWVMWPKKSVESVKVDFSTPPAS